MSTVKRFSYSLLISTLAFTVFAIVAFSGLFTWLEVQFYSPKVIYSLQSRLNKTEELVQKWQGTTLAKVVSVLDDNSFVGVFSPISSQEAIQKRFQSAKFFLRSLHGVSSLRILSSDGSQIHFSSEDGDVKIRSDFSLTYRVRAEISDFPEIPTGFITDGKAHVISKPLAKQVYFIQPWHDKGSNIKGLVLLAVSLEDLKSFSETAGDYDWGDGEVLSLGSQGYLFSLLGQQLDKGLVEKIRQNVLNGILPPFQRIAEAGSELKIGLVIKGDLGVVVPMKSFELDPNLKALLLISFFTVFFLSSFLVANLKGEPLSVVTRKVKRFQLQVVKQYLDVKERDKLVTLREELSRHSDEIQADVRRSLGKVRKRDREWVDKYIDTSWQEVMELLRAPSTAVSENNNSDWKRLEVLLQQALTQGRFVISQPKTDLSSPVKPEKEIENSSTKFTNSPKSNSNFDSEEIEELEELEDEVEETKKLKGERVEVLDELESLEDGNLADELEEIPPEEEVLEDLDSDEDIEAGDLEEISEQSDFDKRITLSSDDDGTEELEELEEGDLDVSEIDGNSGIPQDVDKSKTQGEIFHLRGSVDKSEKTADLSTADEDGNLDFLEELTDFEDAPEELVILQSSSEESIPLEHLDEVWMRSQKKVFDEDDEVISLKDDFFTAVEPGSDQFAELVNDVLAGSDAHPFLPLEEDLIPTHASREWKWTGGGFDWDLFAQGNDEVNLFRALSEIVTEMDGFTAAILTESPIGWAAQSSVGFSDAGKSLLNFKNESSMVKGYLSIRALHVLKGGGSNPVIRQSFHSKDLKFMKAILCVPLLFRHESAWLLLGLRREPGNLLTLLAPRQVG